MVFFRLYNDSLMFSSGHMEAGDLIGQDFTIYFCVETLSNYQSKFS